MAMFSRIVPAREPGVLQHHAVAARAGLPRVTSRISVAGHLDAAAVHIVETHQQVDEGGLAAAGGADDGDALAGLHIQIESPRSADWSGT